MTLSEMSQFRHPESTMITTPAAVRTRLELVPPRYVKGKNSRERKNPEENHRAKEFNTSVRKNVVESVTKETSREKSFH
jgi:hypothetical protein